MTQKERATMQQALEALEELHYSSGTVVAAKKYEIATAALREALAEQAEQERMPITEPVVPWLSHKVAEQAEQEPNYFGLTHDHTWLSIDKKQYDKFKPEGRMACYATPVRTKDLTDDEVAKIKGFYAQASFETIVRAAIAADREKNR